MDRGFLGRALLHHALLPGALLNHRFLRPGRPAGCRAAAAVAALALVVACGDSPTSPDVNVAGDWTGTWTFDAAGVMVTDELTANLSQSDGMVTGTWAATGGASGQIRFDATRVVDGTLTISQPLLGSAPCNGSTTIAGTAAADRIDVTLADIPPQGVCQWGTSGRFVLTR